MREEERPWDCSIRGPVYWFWARRNKTSRWGRRREWGGGWESRA